MKSIIVYFSQTGNTKKIAEVIHSTIRAVTGHSDVVKLQAADVNDLVDYDLIGLGCPCFAREEPLNVRRFTRGLRPLRGKLCFIFATHGGHPGDVLPS
ncbi:flavodoxin family protein, partial [Chloroflexota bacterium]